MVTLRLFELRCAGGTVAIVRMPVSKEKPYSQARLQQAVNNHHVEVLGSREITEADLPRLPDGTPDRRFRDAWTSDGRKLGHDMDKVRAIHLERLRTQRTEELAKLDVEWMKATGQGRTGPAADIEAQRQKLRDMPQTLAPSLAAAKTVDEVAAIAVADVLR